MGTGQRRGDHPTIAYITPYFWGEISFTYMNGLAKAATDLQVDLVHLVGSRLDSIDHSGHGRVVYNLISDRTIDGLIFWGSQFFSLMSPKEVRAFHAGLPKLPSVSIGSPVEGLSSVLIDDKDTVYQALNYLQGVCGAQRIAFVQGPAGFFNATNRYQHFLDWHREQGQSIDPRLVSANAPFKKESGAQAIRDFLDRGLVPGRDFDAILSCSDVFIPGLAEELNRHDYFWPDDVYLISVNNRTESRNAMPAVTTMDTQLFRHGYEALAMIVDQLRRGSIEPEHRFIPSLLVPRLSCGEADRRPTAPQKTYRPTATEAKTIADQASIPLGLVRKPAPPNWCSRFIDAFFQVLETGRRRPLHQVMTEIVGTYGRLDDGIPKVVDALQILETSLRPFLAGPEAITGMRLLDEARHQIEVAIQTMQDNLTQYSNRFLHVLYMVDRNLEQLRSIEEIMTSFGQILVQLDLPACYVALYTQPEEPLAGARLAFAYDRDRGIQTTPTDCYFDPKELLPQEYWPTDRRANFVVLPLYYDIRQIGFAIFEEGSIHRFTYYLLGSQLSEIMFHTEVLNRLVRTEVERTKLMASLAEENERLEATVAERTRAILLANEDLREAKELAERASQAKSQFLTAMSHEIRTPLNGILGFADLLTEHIPDADRRKYGRLLVDETLRLRNLVNQILDLSKIESGHHTLRHEVFNLHDQLAAIGTSFARLAAEKQLTFQRLVDTAIPPLLVGDEYALRQILLNLLDNALKFTSQGSINLEVRAEPPVGDTIELHFAVRDTGIGIPLEVQADIFESFVQASEETAITYGGTGLGTTIARQLVELMGGRIGLDSRPGLGTTFWFTLAFGRGSGETRAPMPTAPETRFDPIPNFSDRTVLAVDDYPTNLVLLTTYLAPTNCTILTATEGTTALALAREHRPDFLLIDIRMPGLSGLEVVRELRADPDLDAMVIVGVTANAFQDDAESYRAIGFQDVIVKPFRKKQLFEIIGRFAHGPTNHRVAQPEAPRKNRAQLLPLDLELLAEELDCDRLFIRGLVEEFLKNARRELAAVTIGETPAKGVGDAAHSIKGAAAGLSANPTAKAASELEGAAAKNDVALMIKAHHSLVEAFDELDQYTIETCSE